MPHIFVMIFELGFVHVALSLMATIHILLTKRETSPATGWIGICWFMPYVGSLLYWLLGINRVHRRARQMMDDEMRDFSFQLTQLCHEGKTNFQPLVRMLDRLTEQPLLRGNDVTCLHNGDQAYPKMLQAIEQAQHVILMYSYIFRDDDIGGQFIKALTEAHHRGVKVRVLVDGIGSGYLYSGVYRRLRRNGVPCARFMHSFWPWGMTFINLRSHRKILVVDGQIGFMGGLNIGQENILAQTENKNPVSDMHFLFSGPVVCQLTDTFARDWSFTTQEELEGRLYFPDISTTGDVPARVVTSGPDNDVEKIEYTMLQAIILARQNVCFMTPYFVPDNRFSTQLGLAALRGIRVDIIVPRRSNHLLIDYARDAGLRRLVEVGCHIWMGDPPFNHSKLMTVDGEWSFVGSANLDRRSLRLNFEVNIELHGDKIAHYLEKCMKGHCQNALTLEEIDAWPVWKRLRDAALRLFLPYL